MDLKKILSGAQLPALPQSAIRLLELSQDPSNGPTEFAVPIESDPGLAGQVLRFVNSSYFGFAREISSVKLAITLVGIRTIKNFALWSAVFSLMPNPKCGPFDLKQLWQDSLRRALFARRLSKLLGLKEAEEAFSAALLQDMAVPLLAKEAPAVYAKLLEARHQGQRRLSALEQQLFGWNHGQAGAMMARQWNLPEEFATLIEAHVMLDQEAGARDPRDVRCVVGMSALLPTLADPLWLEAPRLEALYTAIAPPGHPTLAELLASLDQEFSDFAPLLKISTAARSLAEMYSAAAPAAERFLMPAALAGPAIEKPEA